MRDEMFKVLSGDMAMVPLGLTKNELWRIQTESARVHEAQMHAQKMHRINRPQISFVQRIDLVTEWTFH
jgi:hypothetical protein